MNKLSRRRFMRFVAGSALLSALKACAPGEQAAPESTLIAPGPPTPPPLSSPMASPTSGRTFLSNDNVPGFFVRYYRPFEAVDPGRWTLSVEGLVDNPQHLSLSNVTALPRISQVSRMKCVECWSAAAKWEGFHLSSLMELANPKPEARWLHIHCADGYYESMSLEALLRERVVFVHHMNDEILPDIYGAPLRLMVPFRYGYKSAKAIIRLDFAQGELVGYWSSVAPYTSHGNIRRGQDNPLDLEGSRNISGGAEIFYPDGPESRQ